MFDINAFTKALDSKLRSAYIEELSFLMLKHIKNALIYNIYQSTFNYFLNANNPVTPGPE